VTKTCQRKHCYAPDNSCLMGEDDYRLCKYWAQGENQVEDGKTQDGGSILLPWSGGAFGVADLSYLASQTHPRVVALIGPLNSGKTTLLATMFLLLLRGKMPPGFGLARSLTLGGWETVAHWMKWKSGQGPQFPEHTTSREQRVPGLLHVGMRDDSGGLTDLAVSDAPGEWFRRWAVDETAADAAGARWLAANADAFVLVVDSEALSGEDRGPAQVTYELLAERIASHVNYRPVRIVWTKSDITITTQMVSRMNDRFSAVFGSCETSHITVNKLGDLPHEQDAFLNLLGWMLTASTEAKPNVPAPVSADYFLAFR